MKLSVVIPVYNEEKIIEAQVRQVAAFFNGRNLSWELIAVDDGSIDNSKAILERLIPMFPELRVFHLDHNRGKGAAVREGCEQSRGEFVLFMDADLSVPLSCFEKFWDAHAERKVLIGSRALDGSMVRAHQFFLREWAGKFGNLLTRILLPLPFRDTQCGFKLFPGSFRGLLPLTRIDRAGFDIEWLLSAWRSGYQVEEIPVEWSNRKDSRFSFFDYPRTLVELYKIFANDCRGRYGHEPRLPA